MLKYLTKNHLCSFLIKVKLLVISLCLIHSSGPLADIESLAQEEVLKQIDFSENLVSIINNKSEEPVTLTDNDREALGLLGYTDAEIDALQKGDLLDKEQQQKMMTRINSYANKKNNEIYEGANETVVPGLASAVIGLAFASLLGVVVGVKCYNQPSALTFAGTSAAWAGLEMMIWQGYQVDMKDIETLMDATEIPNNISKEVQEMKAIVSKLEQDLKSANIENYDQLLKDNEKQFNTLEAKALKLRDYLNKAKDSQFGAVRSIQESLELAAETSEKKSKNAKVAAIGFTAAAGVATAETFKAFGDGGKCFGNNKTVLLQRFFRLLLKYTPSAHAGFANLGDLDKIGIPVGAGLGAAYIHFEQSFADKIYNSAPTRAAVFLAMAGLAYYASTKLKEASVFLRKQADEMNIFATSLENALGNLSAGFDSAQELIFEIKQQLLPAYDELLETIKTNQQIKDSLAEVENQVNELKGSELSSDIQNMVNQELSQNETDINSAINEAKSEVSAIGSAEYLYKKTSFLNFLDYLLPSAVASYTGLQITPSCFKRGKYYPLMDKDCSCQRNNRCMSSRFPKELSISNKNEFVSLASKNAYAISKANDFILSGYPQKGLLLYKKLSNNTSHIEKSSIALLNQKVSKNISPNSILKLTNNIRKSSKQGLGHYFNRNKGRLKVSPRTNQSTPFLSKSKESPYQKKRQSLIASLKLHAKKAQTLGNSSLQEVSLSESNGSSNDIYNYSDGTIIKDTSVDLFLMIKKRYMRVHADGRL